MLQFLDEHAGALTVLFSLIVALSTLAYAILTWRLTSETRRLREVQTEPTLEVVVRPTEEWINFLRLYVRNIGSGPARNVRFTISPVTDGEGAKLLIQDFTRADFLLHGLDYLGPGEEVVSPISSFTESFEEKIEAIVSVVVGYDPPRGKRKEQAFTIPLAEFRGLEQAGRPPLYEIARSLESIAKNLNKVSARNRLQLDMFSEVDRSRERAEFLQRAAERNRDRSGTPHSVDSPEDDNSAGHLSV